MYERFTDRARKVMQLANQEAQRFNHEYIGTEHVLLGLIKEGSGVAANVLKNLDVDLRKIRLEVEKIVQSGPEMVMGKLPQTPRTKKVIEYALEEAQTLNHSYVGTEHLLLGLLRETEGIGAQVLTNLGLKLDDVRQEVLNLLGHATSSTKSAQVPGDEIEHMVRLIAATSALDRYCRDLTQLAHRGDLEPCIGREKDLDQLIRILARQTRNRPLLLGVAGAGKSALVRGLAHFLANPPQASHAYLDAVGLRDCRVVSVDLSLIVSGRHQVEERAQAIAAAARNSRVVLVLDDLHQWASYQSALLALALDTLPRVVATATLAGFERLSEKVPTLDRAFHTVRVASMSAPDVLRVLFGMRPLLEKHHRIGIFDGALHAVVECAEATSRWGPSLMDQALDLLDEAAAWVRQRAFTLPPDLSALNAEIEKLNSQKEAAVAAQDFELATSFRDQADQLRQRRELQAAQWWSERKGIDARLDAEGVREFVRQSRIGEMGEPF